MSTLSTSAEVRLPAGTRRARTVALDVRTLPDPRVRAQVAREPAIPFDLFPDVSIAAIFDRFDANAIGVTWVGHIDGTSGSVVTLERFS